MNQYTELINAIYRIIFCTYTHLEKLYSLAIEEIELELLTDGYTNTICNTYKLQIIMAKSAKEYLKAIINNIEEMYVYNYKIEKLSEDAKEVLIKFHRNDVYGGYSKTIESVISTSLIKYYRNKEPRLENDYMAHFDEKFACQIVNETIEYLFSEEKIILKEEFAAFDNAKTKKLHSKILNDEKIYFSILGKLEAIQNIGSHFKELLKKAGFKCTKQIGLSRYRECLEEISNKERKNKKQFN